MKIDELPDVLTLEEVTELLRVSKGTLIKEIKAGKIKYTRIGRQYRFKKSEIVDYMNS